MMNKKEFTKFAKRILHSGQGVHQPKPINPSREWAIGLLVAVFVMAGSGVWSAQTYLKYRDASVGETDVVDEGVVVYRESLVKAALEKFDQRKESLDGLLKNKVVPVTDNDTADSMPGENQDNATSSETVGIPEQKQPTTTDTLPVPEAEATEIGDSPEVIPTLAN